ncbi:MAG: beta-ketoacyl synthase N-terminal-like domain-containing protein [Nitrospirota bacterium]
MKRIVITGIGAVSPLGNTFEGSSEAIMAGMTGIRRITKFETSSLPWKVAGELRAFNATKYLSSKEMNRLDPFVQYALAASVMAVEDSGLLQESEVILSGPKRSEQLCAKPKRHRNRVVPTSTGTRFGTHFEGPASGSRRSGLKNLKEPYLPNKDYLTSGGVIIGSSRGGISTIENAFFRIQKSEVKNPEPRFKASNLRLSPYIMPSTTISMASSYVAQKLGIKGYCLGISNACASGTNAVGEAFRLLKSGHKGPLLAGGAEAPVCALCIEGYGVSGALSKTPHSRASRPFDRTRDGFVLSEGSCVLMLEDYDIAVKRGAKIYSEIIGYVNTTDAFHQTKPDSKGEALAMESAIAEAGITPQDIDYINTHGTSTLLGDMTEADAIRKVFGKRASEIPATAIKSMTGHMLAASGAFETACTVISLKKGIIPPTINLREQDTRCSLNIVTKKTAADISIAISNSFGFGGVNAVLVLKRFS